MGSYRSVARGLLWLSCTGVSFGLCTLAMSRSQEEQKGTIDGELATVIASVSLACKQIASLVNRAGISNLTGVAGAQNVQASRCG